MSPISVAQFLPPGILSFDLLIIDEASQVRPEDALGAIARVSQIVVVGDQQQQPPTNFFNRLADDIDTDEDTSELATAKATELESILTLCEARGVRSNMLKWHYRSKDPSLIRVSNEEFYKNSLIIPPSPLQIDPEFGLKFTPVSGVYSSKSQGGGRAGTNRIEAEKIAEALAAHARKFPTWSVGIVAFSKAQSEMITEVLEMHRRTDKILDAFLREGKEEDVFVKNIENVQGDERDVIMISVGYGPHRADERLSSMNFGPINGEGGERRLNVLFTRARLQSEIFASFDPADIDLSRTSREGPRILKRFLQFAKSGELEEKIATGQGADSQFEEDVMRIIEDYGYHADPQVCSAGFRIDIGVRHLNRPAQYILAVECDGATWHSSLWARERDRLRQEVLEAFGWKFHRIWSTDWFYRRPAEISRLHAALDAVNSLSTPADVIRGSNETKATSNPGTSPPSPLVPAEVLPDKPPGIQMPPYQQTKPLPVLKAEPEETDTDRMAEIVADIVKTEGPVHTDVVVRRIAEACSKTRLSSAARDNILSGLDRASNHGRIFLESYNFWMTAEQKENPPVRDRSAEQGSIKDVNYIAPLEILAAATIVDRENGTMERDEKIRAVSRLLGFGRTGNELKQRIDSVLTKAFG